MADPNAELPALIREVRLAGYRVNNLFERQDGAWQANIRSRQIPLHFDWGYGPNAVAALRIALEKAQSRPAQVASLAVVGTDTRHPYQLGATTDVTKPIPPSEIYWTDADLAAAAQDDDDDLIGGPAAPLPAAVVEPDPYLEGIANRGAPIVEDEDLIG